MKNPLTLAGFEPATFRFVAQSPYFERCQVGIPAWKTTVLKNFRRFPKPQLVIARTGRCCIRRGPGGERILDVVPRGPELGTQVKTGSRTGPTHSQLSPSRVCWSFILRN